MKHLIYLLSLFLLACGSSPDQVPKVNDVALNVYHIFDATQKAPQTYTLSWLNRSTYKPLKLVEVTIKDQEQVSEAIYQWNKGDKTFYKITIVADAGATSQYIQESDLGAGSSLDMDARFGEQGNLVYQRVLVNNRYHQLSEKNLLGIEAKATQRVELLKERNPKRSRVYQGHWNDEVFTDCDGETLYDVEFLEHIVIPESAFLIIRARKHNPFIVGDDTLEDADIIWQLPVTQGCFVPPEE